MLGLPYLAEKANSGEGMGRRCISEWSFFLVQPSEYDQSCVAFSNPNRKTYSWQVIHLSKEKISGQQDHPCTPPWQVMTVSIWPCAGEVIGHLLSLYYPFSAFQEKLGVDAASWQQAS